MTRKPLLAVLAVLALGVGAALGASNLGRSTPVPIAAVPTATPALTAAPTATPEPTPTPTPPPPAIVAIPIVPVADWRSTADSIGAADLTAIVSGKSTRWKAVEVVAGQEDAILAALGDAGRTLGERIVTAPDAATLMTDLAAHRERLAFMRVDQVGPSVRALGWDGATLFGVHRAKTLEGWALTAQLPPVPPDASASFAPYDPTTTATIFASGDLGLDRTVAYLVTQKGYGINWPYSGGTAKITGTTCCSKFGWKLPVIVSTGGEGAMRDLISSADLAIANSEEAAPDKFTFHESGTVFTGNPALLAGIAWAGYDIVGCATNHIGDGGSIGVLQTIASLEKVGLKAFGCGKDLAAARVPAMQEIGGMKIAVLAYNSIPPTSYGATATHAGSAPLVEASVKEDIAAARAAGAHVVIVWPHWGAEYTFGPSSYQKSMGHMMIDAGADLVIGNHPHWAESVEIYKGRPIWYALGNFTFDQSWSEPTMEGFSLELTFRAGTLVQARMHPHVAVKAVQPNLLDAQSGYDRVLAPVYKASGSLLTW